MLAVDLLSGSIGPNLLLNRGELVLNAKAVLQALVFRLEVGSRRHLVLTGTQGITHKLPLLGIALLAVASLKLLLA